jgi:hypothetical protein
MRGGVAVAAVSLALLVAVPLAGAGSKRPSGMGSMTVTSSPRTAGAHGVRLKVTLHYEMQCNYPGAGPLVVTFPKALKLPKQFASGSVLLAGNPVAATVNGQQVTVTVPPHKGILCTMVGPGSLKLTFTRAAKLANPAHKGSYRFSATHLRRDFAATLAIQPS